jgi:hypothetical protein
MCANMPKTGRPTRYSDQIADRICQLITDGYTLRQIGNEFPELPHKRTVLGWLAEPNDYPTFSQRYARAREARAEAMADEIEEISDDGRNDWYEREIAGGRTITVPDQEHIQRSRLRVDTRKWLMSKLLARKYGDRLDVNHSGSIALEALFQRKDEMRTIEHPATEEIESAKTVPMPQAIEDKR